MNVEVTVAGHPGPWRFRGSAALEAWLARRPWVESGGVRALRAASAGAMPALAEGLARAVLANDAGLSGVRVRPVAAGQVAGGLAVALGEDLEIGVAPSDRDWARQAALALAAGGPRVYLIHAPAPTAGGRGAAGLEAEAETIRERLAKAAVTAAAALVLIAPPGAAPPGADDFSLGAPLEPVLRECGEPATLVWPRYLHARLAWEAAGRPDVAERMGARGFATLASGAETHVEALLNEAAEAELAALGPEAPAWLATWLGGRGPAERRPEAGELLDCGLLWRPSATGMLQPAPFVARALLRRQGLAGDQRLLLRGAVVCQPLALELLGRCFALELRLRARVGARAGARPPDKAAELLDQFSARPDFFERRLYPRECPALPEHAWVFASLGELLSALGVAGHSELRELGHLRNALAHGHYAGWAAVDAIRRAEARVDAG